MEMAYLALDSRIRVVKLMMFFSRSITSLWPISFYNFITYRRPEDALDRPNISYRILSPVNSSVKKTQLPQAQNLQNFKNLTRASNAAKVP
jgi:hypothetical protein